MKVVILSAGYGTRLQPLTENQPKSLLPVGGKPMIEHLLGKVESLPGLEGVFLVTNSRFYPHFEKWLHSKKRRLKMELVDDGTESNETRLGAVGDLGLVLQRYKIREDLLVLAGDNLFHFSLGDFIRFAESHRPWAALGVVDVKQRALAREYGVVKAGEGNRIVEFIEKPKTPPSTLVSTGIYWFPREKGDLLDRYLGESDNADRLGDYVHWLLKTDRVFAYRFEGRWFDIGSLESYREAEQFFQKGHA